MAKFRVVLVVCISLSFLALMPGVAQAREAHCRDTLIHDWYMDGQIQGQYRVSCYRAALAEVPNDMIYGTVRRDLSQALSAGLDRVTQEGVAAKPQTLLPAPQARLAASAPTTSQKSQSVLSLVALAFLLLLLLVWCVARWRSRGSFENRVTNREHRRQPDKRPRQTDPPSLTVTRAAFPLGLASPAALRS